MEMINNKKGIFFTVVAITIVSVLILSLTGKPTNNFEKNQDLLETEYNILNSYVDNVKHRYAKNVLYMQTLNALKAMVNITDTNTRINDVNISYFELVTDAKHGGVDHIFMKDMTISNFTNNMMIMAYDELKINSTINISNPRIYQADPWYVRAEAELIIVAKLHNLSFEVNETYHVDVPIAGLQDPVYKFYGYNNTINQTAITAAKFNHSTVAEFIKNRDYRDSPKAPNFLMRLENDTIHSSPYGIESLVHNDYAIADPNAHETTFVDYIFFSSRTNRTCDDGEGFEIFNFTALPIGPNDIGADPDTNLLRLDKEYLLYYGMNDTAPNPTPGVQKFCDP